MAAQETVSRVDFDAVAALVKRLERRVLELEAQPPEPATKTTDFLARPGQTVIVEAPSTGLKCSLVKATKFNRGQSVTFIQRNGNPVTIRAIDGTVNRQSLVVSNLAGTFDAVSDGQTGWLLDQSIGPSGVAGAPGTPGSTPLPTPPGISASAAQALMGSRPIVPGPVGPAGAAGFQGPPGRSGTDGMRGPPGPPGATGDTGPAGASGSGSAAAAAPPGRVSYDDMRRPLPGPTGQPGAAGAAGADGVAGARGRDGLDGRMGIPGPAGAAGSAGAAGAAGTPGPPGRIDYAYRPMIPGPAGQPGATGAAGVAGAILATATVSFGTTPLLTGSFQITGLSGLILNTPVALSMAVNTADPTESEEQVAMTGIATSTSVITAYWQSVDGTPKSGNKLVQYLVPNTVSNLTLSEGQMVGLPITHASPGTNGPAVPVDGTVVGENIRFSTQQNDTTLAGDQGSTSYPILEPVTTVNFGGTSPAILHGAQFSGVGAGTAIATEGRLVICRVTSSQGSVTFKHESGTEASATRRFSCPGSVDFTAYAGDYVILHRVTYASTQRTRVMPFNSSRSYGVPLLWDDENFWGVSVGILPGSANVSVVFMSLDSPFWQGITNRASSGSLANFSGVLGHYGIARLFTGTTINDATALYHTGTQGSGQSNTDQAIDPGKLVRADFWLRNNASANRIVHAGFASNVTDTVGGADGVYFRFDTSASTNWQTVTRSGSVQTLNTSGFSAATTNWTKLSLEWVGSGVVFLINDDFIAYHSTNVPTAGGVMPFVYLRTLAASALSLDVDRVRIFVTPDTLTGP